ncbi:MAG: ABC transporter substrate-binding protein [Nitrospirae bacterium]|nr:ABC transporter substrate-binding protein [Nitrospirota bacterium]
MMKGEEMPKKILSKPYTRRDVLKTAGAGALGLLLSGLPSIRGGLFAGTGDAPEVTALKAGFIPLTDCASVVMASELGLYKKYGLDVTVSKEASWASVRDKLTIGDIHAAHILYGMPYASTLGITGAEGQKKPMVIPMALNQNGQAITLSNELKARGVKSAGDLKKVIEGERGQKSYTFAMTFPPGTHAMWLRYWLASGGINPDTDIKLITIPPPQMVANMRIGNMDGFCVGEPWNARAIFDKIGFTAITSQQIWKNHPEKVLGMTQEFAERHPNTVKALLMALLEASQYIDKIENRPQVAEVIARKEYVNAPVEVVLGRLQGAYDYGDGRTAQEPDYMRFYRDGEATFPRKSHGLWFLTQHRRWGFIKEPIDYKKVVDGVNRTDLYREAATALGVPVPKDDYRKETLFDGIEFDPADPEGYVKKFKIRRV